MKSKINIFLFSILVFSRFISYAQIDQLDSSLKTIILLNKEIIFNQNYGIDIIQSSNQFLETNNFVQLTQIGFYNNSNIDIHSENYKMEVNQNGYNNNLNVYQNAPVLNQTIAQSGNNNYVSDFSIYSGNPLNMSFNQEGNNLSIFNNGSNSISKDLKITQTGDSGTIYIFNH